MGCHGFDKRKHSKYYLRIKTLLVFSFFFICFFLHLFQLLPLSFFPQRFKEILQHLRAFISQQPHFCLHLVVESVLSWSMSSTDPAQPAFGFMQPITTFGILA